MFRHKDHAGRPLDTDTFFVQWRFGLRAWRGVHAWDGGLRGYFVPFLVCCIMAWSQATL